MLTLTDRNNSKVIPYGIAADLTLPMVAEALDFKDHVFFFDIDNCLYDINTGISDLMAEKIAKYGEYIGIDKNIVKDLSFQYYREYGLAIRGFIKHHGVDPNHYDENVDQSLPLESILKPDPLLREMLSKIKMRRWAFTNANKIHAFRVLKLLDIADLFEGITYCDYNLPNFDCKPEIPAYYRAMQDAQVPHPSMCFFADDSRKNLDAAKKLGWNTILVSGSNTEIDYKDHLSIPVITDLPKVLPSLFMN